MKDQLIYLAGSVFFIVFGISLLKMGIKAIKEDDRGVGGIQPKHGVVSGPLAIACGIVVLIVGLIMPLFE